MIANAAGAFAAIFIASANPFKIILKTAAGVTIDTIDQIPVGEVIDLETLGQIVDQAESSAMAAAGSAAEAAGYAAGLNLPAIAPGDAGKQLVVNPAEAGYELVGQPVGGIPSRAWAIANLHPATAPDGLRTDGYASAGDGGGALYKKVASEPAHAGKLSITLADAVTVVWYELAEAEARPEMFGAVRDGATDDGPEIIQSIAYCVAKNATLRLLRGVYSTSLQLNFSGIGLVLADNTTISPTFDEGSAVQYLATAGNILFAPKLLGGLLVHWPSADYSKERWSFLFQNVYQGEFHIGSRNATIGMFLYGNQRGTVYNDFHLGFMTDNCVGIYGASADASGWVNMNRFYGGFFTGNQASVAGIYSAVASHIYIKSTPYANNGNIFLNPSLEWIGPDFKLARLGGLRNTLIPRYSEMDNPAGTAATGSWYVDTGQQNTIDCTSVPYVEGYDPVLGTASRVDATAAVEPNVVGRLGYHDMGASGTQRAKNNHATQAVYDLTNKGAGPALRLRNEASGGNASLEIVNTIGGDGVKIPAAGAWIVYNGAMKVYWSRGIAPTTGAHAVGDLVFNSAAAPGGNVGWVCTTAGTPGTWKTFGTISA